MSVLCIIAHPDDEVLGAGGTLARHATDGADVHVCILSDGVTSRYNDADAATEEIAQRRRRARTACDQLGTTVSLHGFPDNCFDTVPLLDIVQTIEGEIEEHGPDLVYTHHYGDLNIDHELTCRATVTATRPLADSGVERVLACEVLSSSEWSIPEPANAFQPTVFVDISETLDRKVTALKQYTGEIEEGIHPRTAENVRRNARLWGSKSGCGAAESFELLRERR